MAYFLHIYFTLSFKMHVFSFLLKRQILEGRALVFVVYMLYFGLAEVGQSLVFLCYTMEDKN